MHVVKAFNAIPPQSPSTTLAISEVSSKPMDRQRRLTARLSAGRDARLRFMITTAGTNAATNRRPATAEIRSGFMDQVYSAYLDDRKVPGCFHPCLRHGKGPGRRRPGPSSPRPPAVVLPVELVPRRRGRSDVGRANAGSQLGLPLPALVVTLLDLADPADLQQRTDQLGTVLQLRPLDRVPDRLLQIRRREHAAQAGVLVHVGLLEFRLGHAVLGLQHERGVDGLAVRDAAGPD